MPRYTLSTMLMAIVAVSSSVLAQSAANTGVIPLASKHFAWPNLPYQADPNQGVRGTQTGYNICNSTTENQQSMCQTSFLNSIDDFCLWAPPAGPDTIANTEGTEVAWCTKPGHGTRLIPVGALQGVQFMRTPDYVQVVGFIDQTMINMAAGDSGGELDPHGADLRGNPLGGLFYSNSWSNGNNNSYTQVIEWHNFMGGNSFCLKACDPSRPNAAQFCQHIYDRIGCSYNAPNNAQNGTFLACQGDDQDYPGIYTDASGVVQTYTQPAESLGVISTMPYQPKVPASSNCVTYTSAALYAANTQLPSNVPSASGTVVPSGSNKSASASRTGSGAAATGSSGASGLAVTSLSTLAGVAFAVFYLA